MKIAVSGALGRMGQRIAVLALEAGHEIVAAIDVAQHGKNYGSLIGQAGADTELKPKYAGGADVLIDFSLPRGFSARVHECVEHGTALVSGTTGLDNTQQAALTQAAAQIAALWAPNFSLGVNLLFALAKRAAASLPEGYDIEIVEMHHRRKIDAPSGTALGLLRAICEGNGRNPDTVVRHGRHGETGQRTPTEIGMHALRGGDVVGDHTAIFAAEGERIELTHKASSRDTFARGALKAAEWLQGRPAGEYTMAQVLGL
ncbi:MAG: 4-hydroxy-tetrahydrodipicolinate reductase [Planctomycetes bacterium]|nr:4-hydroxy-tetrahydrodipicolinate reductase [Planctomycetota bacterium]